MLMLVQEPGWKLERKGSALLLRRENTDTTKSSSRVSFRCDVEVREFERDEEYFNDTESSASTLAMCASCVVAFCVTIVLPWLLIGG